MKHRWLQVTGAAITAALLVSLAACTSDSATANTASTSGKVTSGSYPNDQYYFVDIATTSPGFVNFDFKGAEAFASQYGVKFAVRGPTTLDIQALVATLATVCASKPSGVIVPGYSPTWIPAIDNCMNEGVPVVLVDSDLPSAKKLAFVGSNWTEVGSTLGQLVKTAVPNCSTIGVLGNIPLTLQQQALTALTAELSGTNIKIITENDQGSVVQADSLAGSLMSANPNLCGLVGLDNNSPDGIVTAIGAAGKAGKVHVWSIESTNPAFLSWVKEGIVTDFVMQHRILWGYYAMQLLYNWNHANLHIIGNVSKNVMSVSPPNIDTGLTIINKSNVDAIAASSGLKD